MLRFLGAGVSDVGLVRETNQDSAFVGPYLALVADGVGGASAGEIASATAAYALTATALQRPGLDAIHVLGSGFDAAQNHVRIGVQRDLERLGMATTMTALVCDGRSVALGHLGDSRAYLWREDSLFQLSADHTYVQRLIDRGSMRPEERTSHPWRNVVLRSVDGDPDAVEPDLIRLDAEAGDRLLLCSDGLTDLVADAAIAVALGDAAPAEAVDALRKAALAAGGTDNVTVVVVDLVDGPRVVGDGVLHGSVRDPRNIVDAAAVRLA